MNVRKIKIQLKYSKKENNTKIIKRFIDLYIFIQFQYKLQIFLFLSKSINIPPISYC